MQDFAAIDLDDDGFVTVDELQQFLDKRAYNALSSNVKAKAKYSPTEHYFNPDITEEIYNMIDVNRDGKITP